MSTKKDKTYKYATEEEYKEANKEKAKQRYKENREEIRKQQREYYKKQREMADKYKYIQNQQNFSQLYIPMVKSENHQGPILEITEISPITLDLSQIKQLLENGRIVTPMTSKC